MKGFIQINSALLCAANKHDIKAVTDVIDNSDIHRPFQSSFSKKNTKGQNQHLCLDRAYNSKSTENEIINVVCSSYAI